MFGTKNASRARVLWRASTIAFAVSLNASAPADAQSAKDFYAGKVLRLIMPGGVGGGYDAYARLLGRHIGDHVPGNPRVVVENMPGASGLLGTNWLYNQAPRDGSVLGSTYNVLLTEPLFDGTAAKYDPTKFEWVGSLTTQYNSCMVWWDSPVRTIQDALHQEVKVATTGLAGNSAKTPLMLNMLLGTKFKVISGYATSDMKFAVERGEVDGICGFSYETYSAAYPDWLNDKKIRFILQTGSKPAKELNDVPLLNDFIKNPNDQAALKVLNVNEEMGHPHMFPPGVPKYLVQAMRDAFDETMKDPKFLEDAHRMNVDPDPRTATQVEKAIREAYAMPKSIVARAAELWPSTGN